MVKVVCIRRRPVVSVVRECGEGSLHHQEGEEGAVVKVLCIRSEGGCFGEGLLYQ